MYGKSVTCANRRFLLNAVALGITALTFIFVSTHIYDGAHGAASRCTTGQLQLGVFQGNSPFELAPLEQLQPPVEGPGAWPVANPVRIDGGSTGQQATMASPFLFPTEDRLFIFYEEAWCTSDGRAVGSIAAAESIDAGLTWESRGAVLSEEWPLYSPFVFEHEDAIFMVPSSPQIEEVNLYRSEATFPLAWRFVKTLVAAPLHSVTLAQHNSSWWLFGSIAGAEESTVQVYRAPAPSGPWELHAAAPSVAQMMGRIFELDGRLLRLGRPCSQAGRCGGVAAFELSLTGASAGGYQQGLLAPAPLLPHARQALAWDGAGHVHADLTQLPDGRWLAVATGSPTQPSLPALALALDMLAWLLQTMVVTALVGGLAKVVYALPAVQRVVAKTEWGQEMLARSWRHEALSLVRVGSGPVPDAPTVYVSLVRGRGAKAAAGRPRAAGLSAKLLRGVRRLPWRHLALCAGAVTLVASAAVARWAQYALNPFWEPAEQLAGSDGRHSKFTLMVMSYDKRLEGLKFYISHYSQCPSVGEILVVWNKGPPPAPGELPAAVPVRVRVEERNSMNNRYKPDPDIRYRAVLSLDDDIMMTCADVERGFAVWREQPGKIVGYYPRLITQGRDGRLEYNWEDQTVQQGAYNALLTGAAFLDARAFFPAYWAPEVEPARSLVDALVNCDDILMVFVVQNASLAERRREGGGSPGGPEVQQQEEAALEFVRPERRVDISYLSGVGLSHNPSRFQRQAEQCLVEFAKIFGGNPLRARQFDWGSYKPPHCGWPATRTLGCFYL